MTTPATPYRNEIDTLEARKRVLESELASLEERIKERRRLPLLDQVRIASPCPAKWDDMVGDERKRFCLSCDKHVFNLTSLTREEAEQFLADNVGSDVCVRYYQRADGTIMTSDCTVGLARKQRKKIALSIAGAGALAFGAVTSWLHGRERHVMGLVAPTETVTEPVPPPPLDTSGLVGTSDPDPGRWIAGGLGAPNPKAPTPSPTPAIEPPHPPKPKPVQGRVVPRR